MHHIKRTHLLGASGLAIITTLALLALTSLGSCFFDTKTTLCETYGLRCKPGQTCAATEAACVDIGGCGDGITSGDEVCDDGNISDGDECSANCLSNESCGNGVVDTAVNEPCDYSVPNTYNCSTECKVQACGNRVQDPGEACDTGGADSSACDRDCTRPTCGDGLFNPLAEECDPGDKMDHLDCDSDCTPRACGDRYTNSAINPDTGAPAEACDTGGVDQAGCNGNHGSGGKGNCQLPRCGDGYHNTKFRPLGGSKPFEGCDAGENTSACNGNDHDADNKDDYDAGEDLGAGNCQAPSCGDGYANPAFTPPGAAARPEACDTAGNSPQCNGHSRADGKGNCQLARCGDGYLNPQFTPGTGEGLPEHCDDGTNTKNCNGNNNASGKGNCQTPACGDGYFNPQNELSGNLKEQCDRNADDPDAPCGTGMRCDQGCQCEPDNSLSQANSLSSPRSTLTSSLARPQAP
jgi:cysteine-rich repeat protein